MNPAQALNDRGQSLWLDDISRDMLESGRLKRYVAEFAVTGLTSNPTIFDRAFRDGGPYDRGISHGLAAGRSGEALFLDLAIEDLGRAADLLRPIHEATSGVDGLVSLEVSPLLAHDTRSTLAAARELHARAGRRPNLLIKIPGTKEGLPAIEEATFAGIPVNVTLLFSREQHLDAAEAYLRGVERRIGAGLDPAVPSVASIFVSRWDVAVASRVPEGMRNGLGCAVAGRAYAAYVALLASPRWQRAFNKGARPQRLLWASTGTKDPRAPDTFYVDRLSAPLTVNTMPERTLLAFADHGRPGPLLPADGGDAEAVLTRFASAGVDVGALSALLQDEGAEAFVKSWKDLLSGIDREASRIAKAG